jgi:hypothetical protein
MQWNQLITMNKVQMKRLTWGIVNIKKNIISIDMEIFITLISKDFRILHLITQQVN